MTARSLPPAVEAALAHPKGRGLIVALAEVLVVVLVEKPDNDAARDWSSVDLPPGVSRRAFRETCARGEVAGAVRDGRLWRCTRGAWASARSRRPRTPRTMTTVTDDVGSWLAAAGLRPTRGRAA